MPQKTTRLFIDVNYDSRKTNPQDLADAMDILMDTAMSTPGILDGQGDPRPLSFFVLIEDVTDNQAAPKIITLPCYGIVVTLGESDLDHPGTYLGGKITSDLHEDKTEDIEPGSSEDLQREQFNSAIDALESMILAHANAGMDITSPAYIDGIETAVEACGNNL